jgi:DNA repair photolyase
MSAAVSGPATYREVEAKSLTRRPGIVDPWFLGRYGMNLYRGCEHGCVYCDGRAEKYFVEGDFERDIVVKRNAVELIRRELGKVKEPGFVLLGGGVCDAYQQAEASFRLARGVLEVAAQLRFPVHVLTKSALVERDFDLLAQINQTTRAILSFSIQTTDDAVRERFEPGAASIAERLRLLRLAKSHGFGVGAMAMPVLPGISDRPEQIGELVRALADAGVDFVCYGGLTLRPGVQKRIYLDVIASHYPQHHAGYERVYCAERRSGAADPRYYERVEERFRAALTQCRLPCRAPRALFTGQMPLYAEVGVLLEHRERALERNQGAGLAAAGHAMQIWAREQITKRGRRRGFTYREVEREFRTRLEDGSLAELPDVTQRALEEARHLARDR